MYFCTLLFKKDIYSISFNILIMLFGEDEGIAILFRHFESKELLIKLTALHYRKLNSKSKKFFSLFAPSFKLFKRVTLCL